MAGYVYILRSLKNKSYYVGCSECPSRRLEEHNSGTTGYTRNLAPWKLVFVQEFKDISEARQRERKIKRLKRRDIIEKIIKDGIIKTIA